jgi:hypothetical protein
MDRAELYNLIEERVNDIFMDYYEVNKISSGDIAPEDVFLLEEIQTQLADLIVKVGQYNKGE